MNIHELTYEEAESRPANIALRWNCGNDEVDDVDGHFDVLLSHLPENEADGPSVFSHRIRAEVPDAPMGGAAWDADVFHDEASSKWPLVLSFMFAMGRRYDSFVGTGYKTDDSDLGSRIEGVILRDQAIRNFVLGRGDYSDELCCVVSPEAPIITDEMPIEQFPVSVQEELFVSQVDDNSWVSQGF